MTGTANAFAILQRSLEVPDVEKLKRAFRSVRCLAESDAHTLAEDAFGILVKNLSANDAMTLQGALQAEGVESAVVLQTDLPQLPPIKFVHQMDCLPEALAGRKYVELQEVGDEAGVKKRLEEKNKRNG